jgi:hypothetical protein
LATKITDGMPLGGIDTRCIDLDSHGTFGLWSIFNNTFSRQRGEAALKLHALWLLRVLLGAHAR